MLFSLITSMISFAILCAIALVYYSSIQKNTKVISDPEHFDKLISQRLTNAKNNLRVFEDEIGAINKYITERKEKLTVLMTEKDYVDAKENELEELLKNPTIAIRKLLTYLDYTERNSAKKELLYFIAGLVTSVFVTLIFHYTLEK
jgi:hypothetical protein